MLNPADQATVIRWRRLAQEARSVLAGAGLPLQADVDRRFQFGARVVVDEFEGTGGVFVGWQPHTHLVDAALESYLRHEQNASAVRHFNTVCRAMRDAMAQILESAGYRVEDSGEDFPDGLRVLSGPERSEASLSELRNGSGS
jgi:hypothetical protein